MAAPLYTTDSGLLWHAGKILVVTVGLPARGKTHISRALERYLRWMGVKTEVISLGDHRRKIAGGATKLPADYFTLGERSEETRKLRRQVLDSCEELILKFFDGGGQVVIYDANNGTREARSALAKKFEAHDIHVIMLESLCDNVEIIDRNIRSVKISSPDYRGWDADKAVEDYWSRIQRQEKYYEPVEETDWPSIRIFNVTEKVVVNKINGYLQARIVFFLMNIHNKPRNIYFARSGQSSLEHSYRADADLSEAGWEYAERLKDFVIERRAQTLKARNQDPADSRLVIWTSARRRAHHTAWPFIAASQQVGSTFVPNPDPGLHGHGSGYGAAAGTGSVSGPEQTGIPSGFDAPAPPPSAPPEIRTSPTSYLPKSGLPPSISNSRAGFDIPLHAPIPQPIADIRPTHTPLPGGGRPSYAQVPGPGADAPIAMGNPEGMPHVRVKVVEKAQMGEINPGVWDGLNPQQVRKYYPQEWRRFSADPYAYRAPRAESYHDLCVRLEPILIELEREQEDLLIIGHASVIRCLLAYLIGLPAAQVPAVEVARGDLIEVVPTSYGVRCQTFHFWDGPGRRHGDTIGKDETNFYENYAEDTKGKKVQVT